MGSEGERPATRPRVLMIGPFPPAVGGLANNMGLLLRSSLSRRCELIPFSTNKRRTRVFPNRAHWDSIPYLVWHALKLLVTLPRVRPDVVYLKATSDTGFVRDTVLMTLARLLGKPVLCHLHGRPMGTLFREGTAASRFTRWGMRRAAVTVVLSPGLAQQFAAFFPGQELLPVPNVVDVDRFRPGAARAGGRLRVITVGRLSREKGTWDLIEVVDQLRSRDIDAEFRLCGIGETATEESALRDAVLERGLEDRIAFLGTVRGDALRDEYAGADAFFLPTHAEIFPNVVLEALASGLPVVTTNVPVIPEMFTHGTEGWLHDPGDATAMATSLAALAGDPELVLRMGQAARSLAETRYAVERAAETLGDRLIRLAADGN